MVLKIYKKLRIWPFNFKSYIDVSSGMMILMVVVLESSGRLIVAVNAHHVRCTRGYFRPSLFLSLSPFSLSFNTRFIQTKQNQNPSSSLTVIVDCTRGPHNPYLLSSSNKLDKMWIIRPKDLPVDPYQDYGMFFLFLVATFLTS